MTESMNLLTAQITFLSSRLVLVHLPLEFLHFFIQPLFAILFGRDLVEGSSNEAWTDRHVFLNFSITPVGCSLICSKYLVDKYLTPVADQFNSLIGACRQKSRPLGVEISQDEYVVIEVDGQGLEAGQRVLELTAPLAMAGISIFFITTYFSDYILVPCKAKQTVLTTLRQRRFVFSEEAEAYVSQLSPTLNHHNQSLLYDRPMTGSSSGSESRPASGSTPMTPPAKDVPELQIRTFTKLMNHNIEPIVDERLRLFSCAGTRGAEIGSKDRLKDDLIQVLLASSSQVTRSGLGFGDLSLDDRDDLSATFLSITLSTEPISILMEECLLPHLGSTLLISQNEEDILTPIILDLRSLGWQATGIVGGVAGRLSQRRTSYELGENLTEEGDMEISFLSTAKAGSVLVQANKLDMALKALRLGMDEVRSRI